MTFTHATCELCGAMIFDESKLIAFRLAFAGSGGRAIWPLELHGQQPWSGVRCVCAECCKTIAFLASHRLGEAEAPPSDQWVP